MTPSLRPLVLFAGLALGLAARGADPVLAPSSPFAPPDGSSATTSAENQPLELRGILADGAGYRFSVYDPAKKSGQWVRLNESGRDFTVKTHDAARDAITLDYQGRMLTLKLQTAKVVGIAVADPAAMPRAGAVSTPGMGPQPKAATPEEAARFNRAVEEINRRRALRSEKNSSPGPMPMPAQGSSNSGPTPNLGPTPNSGPTPVPGQGSGTIPTPRP